MRTDGLSADDRSQDARNEFVHRPRPDPASAAAQEGGGCEASRPRHEARPAASEVRLQSVPRGRSVGYDPFLRSLAEYARRAAVEIQIIDVQPAEFGNADARAVQQL